MMDERDFTSGARDAVAIAREAARRRFHDYVGAEHVLLGIISEATGSVPTLFERLGIDGHAIERRIDRTLPQGDVSRIVGRKLPFAGSATSAIEFAVREAHRLRQDRAGRAHLLLGVLREGESIAALALNEAGVTLDGARAETAKLHEEEQAACRNAGRAANAPISTITIELRRADGTTISEAFSDVLAAMSFLTEAAHPSAHRSAS
jgi:ATP-dependent Clp protease ATP-binding subunit ClpA